MIRRASGLLPGHAPPQQEQFQQLEPRRFGFSSNVSCHRSIGRGRACPQIRRRDPSWGVAAGCHFLGKRVAPQCEIAGGLRCGNLLQQPLLKSNRIESRASHIHDALQNEVPEPPDQGGAARRRHPMSASKPFHSRENGRCVLRLNQVEQSLEVGESRLQGEAFDELGMPAVTMDHLQQCCRLVVDQVGQQCHGVSGRIMLVWPNAVQQVPRQ